MNEAQGDGGSKATHESDGMGIEEELWVKEIQPLLIKGLTPEEISWETGNDEYLVQAIIERRSNSRPSWALKIGLRCSQVTAIVERCLRGR